MEFTVTSNSIGALIDLIMNGLGPTKHGFVLVLCPDMDPSAGRQLLKAAVVSNLEQDVATKLLETAAKVAIERPDGDYDDDNNSTTEH